jgi:uncharacterized protein
MRCAACVLAVASALAGCNFDPAAAAPPVATPPDAPASDARPEGQLDGLCEGEPGTPRVLVFARENLWRHESNYDARLAIYDMCETRGFTVETTNDPLAINATRLAHTDVVVFSLTSGDVMDALGRADFEAWMRAGGGLIGIHSASATEWRWPFYVGAIGAQFGGHNPGMQPAMVDVVAPAHPITESMTRFAWTDEWYFFQSRPEEVEGLDVVLALDEDTLPADYPDEYKVGYHPIAWAREKDGGRMFYTALGHNPAAFRRPELVALLGRAIEWAARRR